MREERIEIELVCGHVLRDIAVWPPYRVENGIAYGPEREACPTGGRRGHPLWQPITLIRVTRVRPTRKVNPRHG